MILQCLELWSQVFCMLIRMLLLLLWYRLFEAHPEYQKLFRVFESLSLQELEKSAKLSAHATNVMYSLTSVIDNLEDPECLTELLIKLGQNHDRHGVSEKEFNVSWQTGGAETCASWLHPDTQLAVFRFGLSSLFWSLCKELRKMNSKWGGQTGALCRHVVSPKLLNGSRWVVSHFVSFSELLLLDCV